MTKVSLLSTVLCLFLALAAAPGVAEDYPGADRQQAEALEAQAKDAIDNATQQKADTRTAQFLYDKGKYEISANHAKNAQRYFQMSVYALRPPTPPPAVVQHAEIPPAVAPAASASPATTQPSERYATIRHKKHRPPHHRKPPAPNKTESSGD